MQRGLLMEAPQTEDKARGAHAPRVVFSPLNHILLIK